MSRLKKRLMDEVRRQGVSPSVKGTRESSVGNRKLVTELVVDHPEGTQILTKHGARLVLSATKSERVSYQGLVAALIAEAEAFELEANRRHEAEVSGLVARIVQLEENDRLPALEGNSKPAQALPAPQEDTSAAAEAEAEA